MNNLLKLNGAIGPDDEDDNRPDDVSQVQGALTDLGRTPFERGFHPDETPVREIERVQIDNDLKIDGRARPGGPTERALNNELLRKRDEDKRTLGGLLSDPRVRKPVGMAEIGKSNTVGDLARTEDVLTRIGRPPQNEHRPTDLMRADAVGRSLMDVQSAAGLERDGVMTPGGPTERELKRQLQKIDQLADAPKVSPERRVAAEAGTSGGRGREPAEGVFMRTANFGHGTGVARTRQSGSQAATGSGVDEAALTGGDGLAGLPPGAGLLSQNEIDRKAAAHFNRDATFRVTRLSGGRFAFSDGRTGDAFIVVPRETGRALANAPGTLNGQNLDARLGMIRDGLGGAVTESNLFNMAQALLIGGSGTGVGTAFGGLTDETEFDGERVEAFLFQIRKLRGVGLSETERRQVTAAMMMTVFPRVLDGGESLTRFLMELMPGTGNVLSGVEAKRSFDASVVALRKGDLKGFLIAGGMTVLNAVGALPGVGNAAKPGIKLAQRGLFRKFGRSGETMEEFLERLSKNAETPARKRQSITEFATDLVDDGWLKGLSQADRDVALRAFRTIFAEGAEGYVARRIAQLQKRGAPEALRQKKISNNPGAEQPSNADLLIFRNSDDLRDAFDARMNDVFPVRETMAIVLEVKAGRSKLTAAQKRIKAGLESHGRGNDFKELVVPLHEIDRSLLVDLAKHHERGMPRVLRPELRAEIVAQLQKRMPTDAPKWLFLDLYARFVATLPREAFDNQ